MEAYTPDPDAQAVVLYDVGEASFDYNNISGFRVKFQRHQRIKVLGETGLDYADFSFRLYDYGTNSKEEIVNLKAYTFNLVDGEIEKVKLSNKDVFDEEIDRTRKMIRFAMPNVKVGSVIEISYTFYSDFFYEFQPWRFQYKIPVAWSEFEVSIPEYFTYNTTFRGYDFDRLVINETDSKTQSISLGGGDVVSYHAKTYHWAAENVPSFKEEAYMAAAENFLTRVEFELSSIKFPYSTTKNYNQSWESINKRLLDDEDFGGIIKRTGPVKDITESLTAGKESPEAKIQAIYDYIRTNIRWNKRFRKYVETNLKKVLDKREGSSGDLNLLLVTMLRAAELEAYPVLVSTRDNGMINPVQPTLSQFNHVIAAVKNGEKMILMDATDKDSPMTLLPKHNLNFKGRIVGEQLSDWIDLDANGKLKTAMQVDLTLTEENQLSGEIKYSYEDYAAFHCRKLIEDAGSKEDFVKEYHNDKLGLEVTKHEFENPDDPYEKLRCTYEVNISDMVNDGGDLLYLNPMLYFGESENPFKLAERKYPVDFAFPIADIYIFKLNLPEGYSVEELPEDTSFILPERAGTFSFSAKVINEQIIQVTSLLSINKPMFVGEEYGALKEFFNLVIEKHAEQIVLKKKT
ncbi:MAG: hypothetical protein DHS20C18_53180 [Saprospiraceae bacterium]|nr:MAG: hypothetical protein DHS20C18_53180 [Saprospiraceae bacterium]